MSPRTTGRSLCSHHIQPPTQARRPPQSLVFLGRETENSDYRRHPWAKSEPIIPAQSGESKDRDPRKGAQRAAPDDESERTKKAHPALRATDSLLSTGDGWYHGEISTFSSVALASALLPKLTPSQAPSGSRHAYLWRLLDL